MYLNKIVLIFLFCFGNSLTEKEEKPASEDFVPSNEWKEIREGQKVPSGLHYRINLSTGKKEAKIIDDQQEQDLESREFSLLEDSGETENAMSTNEIEQIFKDVNKKNPENDMPKKFRTLEEIKRDLDDIELIPKSDIDLLMNLFSEYEEEVKKKQKNYDLILNILTDLKYLGHQIDNANEFCKMNGFQKIIYHELNSTNTAIKQEALKLFSVMAQNNPKVKVHISETGGITTLLRILNLENSGLVKKSALTALSCSLRTFPYAQNKFIETGGLTILRDLFKSESLKLKLKIVTFLNDLLTERQKDSANFENHKFIDIEKALYDLNWCQYLNELFSDLVSIDLQDFDSIEKCLLTMKSIAGKCKNRYNNELLLKVYNQYSLLAKRNENDPDDYFKYLSELVYSLANHNVDYNINREEL